MIIVIATIDTTPDSIAAISAAIAELETATRQESGCLDYTFCVELSDPTQVRIVERWTDQASLIEHLATPHVAAFGAAMATADINNMDLKSYEGGEIPFPGRG